MQEFVLEVQNFSFFLGINHKIMKSGLIWLKRGFPYTLNTLFLIYPEALVSLRYFVIFHLACCQIIFGMW